MDKCLLGIVVDLGASFDFELHHFELGREVMFALFRCMTHLYNLQQRMGLKRGFDGLMDQFIDCQCFRFPSILSMLLIKVIRISVSFPVATMKICHNTLWTQYDVAVYAYRGLQAKGFGSKIFYCSRMIRGHKIPCATCFKLDFQFLVISFSFQVETLTGKVIPASFDETTRCPDELVRRIRVSASFGDPRWKGKLLETYDTETDRFIIAPCSWTVSLVHRASVLRKFSDSDILNVCSTSPDAEAPDFVVNQRRMWDYLIQHPNWKGTFPKGLPRVFKRNASGGWTMVEQAAQEATV